MPRALVSVFLKLSGRLYSAADLKPVLSQEVRKLDTSEVRAEETRREALLKEVKDIRQKIYSVEMPVQYLKVNALFRMSPGCVQVCLGIAASADSRLPVT